MKRLALLLGLVLALGVTQTSPVTAAPARELNLYIWSEYIDPEIIKAFEKQTGSKVRVSLYESNEEMIAKLQAGGAGQYDVVVPSGFVVPSMVQLGVLQPLDQGKIPNLKNLAPSFKSPAFDPGNTYSAAYQWGTVGLIYRKDKIKGFEPTWALIFDEKRQPGPFMLIDSPREMMGIALKYLGKSVNSKGPDDVKAAGKLIADTKKSKKSLGFEGGVGGKNQVVAGTAVAAIVYNGDAIKAEEESKSTAFVIPKEGGVLWVDNMAIPARAPNADLAHRFINFVLEPKVGAQLSNFNRYATPNQAAMPFVDAKDKKNPAIYPPAEAMKTLEAVVDLGADNRLYDEVWTAVKAR